MNAEQFKALVKATKIGKRLPDAIYLHKTALVEAPPEIAKFISIVANALKVDSNEWDIVKLFKSDFKLSLLSYPEFFSDPYPALKQSVTVDLSKLAHRVTNYENHENPPILHRKETMLCANHPNYSDYQQVTEQAEQLGFYENPRMIGFKNGWRKEINKKGYDLVDGNLIKLEVSTQTQVKENKIDRHKTALVRHDLSAPMKTLVKHGFLNGDYTVFDYGCGRGDDLRELEAHGIDALGWDPVYNPEADKVISNIVNVGFVINVIEDRAERIHVLQDAWLLTESVLVVSAMLGNESIVSQFQPYKDGVITSRNTFQKYYTQSELKAFIESALDEAATAIAPGIFYIFKDKNLEQKYLNNKHKRTYQWQQLTSPKPLAEEQARILFTQHQRLFEDFWQTCLQLGRCPTTEEFNQSTELKEVIGSHKKALNLVIDWYGCEELDAAKKLRTEDLLLSFALAKFEKRRPYTQQPDDIKRDVKAFFESFKILEHQATELLFKIADTELIEELCNKASETLPASKLTYENGHPHSLTLHKQFLEQLPLILRIYTGAALQIYGELDDMDLVKIHIHSGKVSLMGYEGFENTPLPALRERVKINMAQQDVDFFDYIQPEKRPLLLDKIEYIDESFEDYKKQKAFNKRLSEEFCFKESTSYFNLCSKLEEKNLKLKNYRFYKN